MANVYTSLATSTTTITELSTALQSKYASNMTIFYEDATNLIFTCALIGNKVIKFNLLYDKYIYAYYGDSWTSGVTIVNSIPFFGYDSNVVYAYHLVCGDSFVLINSITGYTENTGIILIAKLTNGNSIATGSSVSSSTTLSNDITLGESVGLIGIDNSFTSDTGLLFKRPIYINRHNVGLEKNEDNTLATIVGLYSISYAAGTTGAVKGDTYFITSSNLQYKAGGNGYPHLKSSLLTEW